MVEHHAALSLLMISSIARTGSSGALAVIQRGTLAAGLGDRSPISQPCCDGDAIRRGACPR